MKMKNVRISCVCLLVTLIALNGLVWFYYQNNTHLTDGSYVYPLDDTYIHLAMAKNLAFHHNWGVVRDEFCSTSSSPLYAALLALTMKIFGDSSVWPLIVNVVFGNLIVIVSFLYFQREHARHSLPNIAFPFYCVFLFTPVLLHVQILSGMEHTLHIFLILSAFMLFSELIENRVHGKCMYQLRGKALFFCCIGLLCLTRYESMFFIAPVIFVLILFRQYKDAAIALFAGFLPVVVFGIYSISQGGFFFPNPLLIKAGAPLTSGIFPALKGIAGQIYRNLCAPAFYVPIMLICIGVLFNAARHTGKYTFQRLPTMLAELVKQNAPAFVVLATILLHGMFARFGWLYRYEAYLYGLLCLIFTLTVYKQFPELLMEANARYSAHFVAAVLAVFLLPFMSARFYGAHGAIKYGGKNIYDQQIQMARFLRSFYNDAHVVANDIGAIAYFTNIKLLDVVGLGSTSVLKYKVSMGGVIC